MACYINLYRTSNVRIFHSVFINKTLLKCLAGYCGCSTMAVNADPDNLDNFTTQLMQKKTTQWDSTRIKRKPQQIYTNCDTKLQDNTNVTSDMVELGSLLWDAIESSNTADIEKLTHKFLTSHQLPNLLVLDKTLSFYSSTGNKDTVSEIINLCNELKVDGLKENSYFNHYLAESIWIKGNINKALGIFEDIYRNSNYLRRKVRSMLKYLITETIAKHSEAALINVIKVAERMVVEFNDFFLLASIWETCFLSEWYSDQSIALELLTRHSGLPEAIGNRLPFIIALVLKNEQTEIVYRLLEIFLKTDQKTHSSRILEALFDYKVRHRDLRGCTEILKWSIEHEIDLSVVRKDKFLDLLLCYKHSPVVDMKNKIKPKTQCNYKF